MAGPHGAAACRLLSAVPHLLGSRTGEALALAAARGRLSPEAFLRFAAKLAPHADGCIDWIGAHQTNGYGVFWLNGKPVLAHRVACEVYHRARRGAPLALHACDRPVCCAFEHLSWGTQSLNTTHQYQRGRRNRPQLILGLGEVA